jgi:hypothetical protein
MTFIFAKDKSLASVREAIENRRTLAYSYGTLAGEESLLRKFIEASLTFRKAKADKYGKMQYIITNNSSVEFLVKFPGGNPVLLEGLSSTLIKEHKSGMNELVIESAWCAEDKRITIKIQ